MSRNRSSSAGGRADAHQTVATKKRQRRGIRLHALERDYIQYPVLSILYTNGQSFVFKGGTALRVVYHSPRYSEDLDFNTTVNLEETKRYLREALTLLGRYGVIVSLRNEY